MAGDPDERKLNQKLLTQLGRSFGTGLEASGPSGLDPLSARIGPELLRDALGKRPPRLDDGLRERVIAESATGLEKLRQDGLDARLHPLERAGVEAVIHADGSRPVLFIRDGAVDREGVALGQWSGALDALDERIRAATASVGRIGVRQSRYRYQGTGFVVGEGLLLTNRHVLQMIGIEDAGRWVLYPEATVDFGGELSGQGGALTRDVCDLLEVVDVGRDPIVSIDPKRLDMALLRFRETRPDRAPLRLSRTAGRVRPGAPIYVMGFPAAADVFYGDGDPFAGTETAEVMTRLFMDEFGVKRFAPGYVDTAPGEVDDGGEDWVFEHDASTLGGNSGSKVMDFSDGLNAVGLHFGGGPRKANYAHVLAALRDRLEPLGVLYG